MSTSTSNLHVNLLQRIADVSQKDIAAAMQVDPATISRIKNGESGVQLSGMAVFFDQLGLKVVPSDSILVDQDEYKAITDLAFRFLEQKKRSAK